MAFHTILSRNVQGGVILGGGCLGEVDEDDAKLNCESPPPHGSYKRHPSPVVLNRKVLKK